jgi:hypothetical protein
VAIAEKSSEDVAADEAGSASKDDGRFHYLD